jgi:hypothetical protein
MDFSCVLTTILLVTPMNRRCLKRGSACSWGLPYGPLTQTLIPRPPVLPSFFENNKSVIQTNKRSSRPLQGGWLGSPEQPLARCQAHTHTHTRTHTRRQAGHKRCRGCLASRAYSWMRLRPAAEHLRSSVGAPVATLLHLREVSVRLRWHATEFGARL